MWPNRYPHLETRNHPPSNSNSTNHQLPTTHSPTTNYPTTNYPFTNYQPPIHQLPKSRPVKPKPSYREGQTPVQGRTPTPAGQNANPFRKGLKFLQSCASAWRRCPTLFVHSKLSAHACAEFGDGKYMLIPYFLCCFPVLTYLAHAYAKYVFQYVTGRGGGM